ncbi:MAG: ThiF family adenylyltransferase [Firmicutes bacterium]|nr:ThiF family adenylyltransferase [Bacillota bacterium]
MSKSITDRQERIEGFKQSLIDSAVIGVIGAGRTANEVIKNLALTGFSALFVADMDHVSDTNLPGTVLFSRADIGESKARLAAEGFKRLSVVKAPRADWLAADVCTGLGEGVLRRCDIVINCVDNHQTRLYVSRVCKLLGKPCVDVGIDGFNWTLFTSSPEKDTPCYACTMTPRAREDALIRVRNSCDVTLREGAKEGRAATIITSAAQAGAMAAEAAIKILHNEKFPDSKLYDPRYGVLSSYSSGARKLMNFNIPLRADCDNHINYAELGGVRSSGLSADEKLGSVLEKVAGIYGEGYRLSLEKDCIPISNRAFVTTGFCKSCRSPIEIYRPQFTLLDSDLLCGRCKEEGREPLFPSNSQRVYDFSLGRTEEKVLGMSLKEIGIPPLHIVEFDHEDEARLPLFLELDGDEKAVIPQITEAEPAAEREV